MRAAERLRAHGFPANSTVYFAVDFDPTGEVIAGPVTDFFRGIRAVTDNLLNFPVRAGVYGSRNVCSRLANADLAEASFVAGASTGWSGNMGFPMPMDWDFNQIAVDRTEVFSSQALGIDRVRVSTTHPVGVDASQILGAPRQLSPAADSSGIDPLFEWICRAEIACEMALKASGFASWAGYIPGIIGHWLRKEAYFDNSPLWLLYTPFPEVETSVGLCLQALKRLEPARPDIEGLAHAAATYMGYVTWDPGWDKGPDEPGWGDLGGWAMDLLQLWGQFLRQSEHDLDTYIDMSLGIDDSSGFGFEDLLGDADGWLIGKAGGYDSAHCRELLKDSPVKRIHRFYQERFGGSSDNVAAATVEILDGLDWGSLDDIGLTLGLLKQTADVAASDPLPTTEQSVTLGRGLAAALVREGNGS